MKAYFALESGQVFSGVSFGGAVNKVCDVVFNTSMNGFTELITDPLFMNRALVLTCPLVGNCGVAFEDFVSEKPQIGSLIVSEISEIESNFRSESSLKAVLERFGIPAIAGVDTRSLVRLLRTMGPVRGVITNDPGSVSWAKTDTEHYKAGRKTFVPEQNSKASIFVPDTGVRLDVVRALTQRGLTVETFGTDDPALFDKTPDGWLLPDGPGDPAGYSVSAAEKIYKTGLPVLALGLGHQLLARANGAKIVRLNPGHNGSNIPVRDVKTNLTEITEQAHSYAVDEKSVGPSVISHVNVNDGTVEGLRWRDNAISVQFRPGRAQFDAFAELLK